MTSTRCALLRREFLILSQMQSISKGCAVLCYCEFSFWDEIPSQYLPQYHGCAKFLSNCRIGLGRGATEPSIGYAYERAHRLATTLCHCCCAADDRTVNWLFFSCLYFLHQKALFHYDHVSWILHSKILLQSFESAPLSDSTAWSAQCIQMPWALWGDTLKGTIGRKGRFVNW